MSCNTTSIIIVIAFSISTRGFVQFLGGYFLWKLMVDSFFCLLLYFAIIVDSFAASVDIKHGHKCDYSHCRL